MLNLRSFLALTTIASTISVLPAQAASTSTVRVEMRDATDDPSMKNMEMMAEPQSVKAGQVSFEVSNKSKSIVHEMIVVADLGVALPYDEKKSKVIESKIKHLGEASDLAPGSKKTLKLKLKPGNYILICNQSGHYHQGMTTSFTVTK